MPHDSSPWSRCFLRPAVRADQPRTKRPLAAEDLYRLERIRATAVSPDRKELVYERQWTDAKRRERHSLWQVTGRAEKRRPLEEGEPDGRALGLVAGWQVDRLPLGESAPHRLAADPARRTRGRADRFDFGGGDMRDILTGIDHLVKEKLVDPERQFVYGVSYGGFMTCWLVGHTNQFRAAVAQNAVTDLNVDVGPERSAKLDGVGVRRPAVGGARGHAASTAR